MYLDFEYYKDKKVVVHCMTKMQAKKFCKLLHRNKLNWANGDSYYATNFFDQFGCNTCYTLDGHFDELEYFLQEKYEIISCADITKGKKGDRYVGYKWDGVL